MSCSVLTVPGTAGMGAMAGGVTVVVVDVV